MNNTFHQQHGYYIEDMELGLSAEVDKTFSEEDIRAYAVLSTDDNPLHMDESFAAQTRAGGRVIHGMVTASLISAIIGTRLPGPGCLWMSQEMRFLQPVRIGDTVHASAEVVEIVRKKQRARLDTTCRVDGKVVLDGQAVVWVPSRSAS